uniref:NADH dehydrogenase subunit 6 n=1 Tax=Neojurtina typica TaxID=2880911 RepID=UPI001D0F4D54|nr:NADH dehydrogenase subunit 6 [Neojurtina typica]UCC46062.1 NADH dehydrogenase subunit 6 [Neojurtina typica]
MSLMLSMMMSMSVILLWLKHPLSMGLVLIIQTLMVSLISGYIIKSFFFSFIIIIIMLSGALVLFIYMASIASNEKFNSPLMLSLFSIMMILIMSYITWNNNEILLNMIPSPETNSLIKMFNLTTSYMTLMAIMYLLLTMIAVSNIAKVTEGPLRMNK